MIKKVHILLCKFSRQIFLGYIYVLLIQSEDEQWKRALEYVSLVSELNYMTQVNQKSWPSLTR